MKAIDHTFAEIELPKPAPAGHDLRVRVEAISVNPVDYKQRKQATSSKVLGWDAAGTVEAVGSEVTLFKPGDAVYYAGDVTRPGCNSEFHLVDERIVGRKPKKLDFAQAAAMPLTSITAWEAFHDRMKVRSGKRMLIINGAGGVGSIGIQLAKIAGLTVVASASRPESIAWVKELGADEVVDHRKPLAPQVKQVDYVANFSGELDAYWDAMAELVAPQGAVVAIVANQKPLAMDTIRSKSATVCWELMFTRPRFKTPDMIEQHSLLNQVADLLDQGKLRCTLRQVFFSTINRNPKAYLFAVIGAEYVLGLLPRGTHDYMRFIKPSELSRWARAAGLRVDELVGMTYNPLTRQYRLADDCDVNYLLRTTRDQ